MAKRRLYRLDDDYLIAGVCSGLGEYFEIEATLVRLVFVLLALTGSGVVIYLILWLIIPKKGESMKDNKMENLAKKVRKKDFSYQRKGNFFGLLLVIVGGIFLLEKLIPMVINWEYVFPGLLVVLGLYLIFRK
jgi:phage shock protein C